VGQRRDCLAKLEGPRGASQPIFVGFGSKAENLKTSRFASKSGPPICTLMSTRPSGCLKSRDSTQLYDGARTDDRCCRSVCAASSRHQRAFSTYLSRRSGQGLFSPARHNLRLGRGIRQLWIAWVSPCRDVAAQTITLLVGLNLFNIEHIKIVPPRGARRCPRRGSASLRRGPANGRDH
jgi:hypothetical protein